MFFMSWWIGDRVGIGDRLGIGCLGSGIVDRGSAGWDRGSGIVDRGSNLNRRALFRVDLCNHASRINSLKNA